MQLAARMTWRNALEGSAMRTLPASCRDVNTVSSFCGCIKDDGSADAAARAFCKRAEAGEPATSDELVELKKALADMDDETEADGACCSEEC